MNTVHEDLDKIRSEKTALEHEVRTLRIVGEVSARVGTILEVQPLVKMLIQTVPDLIPCQHLIPFILDEEAVTLKFGGINTPLKDPVHQRMLEMTVINIYNPSEDVVLRSWMERTPFHVTNESSDNLLKRLAKSIGLETISSFPLTIDSYLIGLVLVVPSDGTILTKADSTVFQAVANTLSIAFQNAYQHSQIVQQLADTVNEMNILHQLDSELKDTIELKQVFKMAMDWALRFTNAHASALALYDSEKDTLRVMENYGYAPTSDLLSTVHQDHTGGITHRVARTGEPQIVPDVSMDMDYMAIDPSLRSQMSIPIMREDRVIAILTLESKKVNGFTDDHIRFVEVLAQRAGVAVDNARLFEETARERQKLSLVLRNIADIVIVIGTENRLMLINQSALAALRLDTGEDITGQLFAKAIPDQGLRDSFHKARESNQGSIEELDLPNGRTYHTYITPQKDIGWIIVMQDITPFKETDKLKSELLATASHDLKQPLSVMRGYIDLLNMTNQFDERSLRFVDSLKRAISNMQKLIDELLDLARIESGIEMTFEPVTLQGILKEGIDELQAKAQENSISLNTNIPDDLPSVSGDKLRLSQIFNNVIGNAIKYNRPKGTVTVAAERQGHVVRVSIKDTGLGISPEDRARIFDRFYRIRRPETDTVEGTGLGLAIVKSLVEAHHGKIDFDSQLNQGSTFHITLPVD